jgi:hypothetical protein
MHVDSFSDGPENKVQTLDIVPGGNGTRYVVLCGTGHGGTFYMCSPTCTYRVQEPSVLYTEGII